MPLIISAGYRQQLVSLLFPGWERYLSGVPTGRLTTASIQEIPGPGTRIQRALINV